MIHRVGKSEPYKGSNKETVVIKSFFYSYKFRYSGGNAVVPGAHRTASRERNMYRVNGATGNWGEPAFDEPEDNCECHHASHHVKRLGKLE